jgi:hypothetical protein
LASPKAAAQRFADIHAVGGRLDEGQLAGRQREFALPDRLAATAAQRTIATQDRKMDASTSLRENLSPSAMNGLAAYRGDRLAEASPPIVCHHTPGSVD